MPSSNSERFDSGLLVDFADDQKRLRLEAMERDPALAQMREKAYREGQEAGRSAAIADLSAEMETLRGEMTARVKDVLSSLTAERKSFQEENQREIIELAVAIARKVTRVEVAARSEILEAKLNVCLQQLDKESSYLIRVHPEDHALLEDLLGGKGQALVGDTPYRLMPDQRVGRGGLVLDGETGRIESICADELESIEQLLLEGTTGTDADND